MAEVEMMANELRGRDPDLARRFEGEIREALRLAPGEPRVTCRILAWQRRGDLGAHDRVTLLFAVPGWVKVLSVPMGAAPGEVRRAASVAMRARPWPAGRGPEPSTPTGQG